VGVFVALEVAQPNDDGLRMEGCGQPRDAAGKAIDDVGGLVGVAA
jgi:hypothetical protein